MTTEAMARTAGQTGIPRLEALKGAVRLGVAGAKAQACKELGIKGSTSLDSVVGFISREIDKLRKAK